MSHASLPAAGSKRRTVQAMFDRIAPRYDAMNRLLTGGLDQRWRRLLLDAVAVGPGDRVLDVACGTGDLAALAAARGARAVGVDFAGRMLEGARRRGVPCGLVRGDAERLPFAEGSASVVTCGFALRNFVHLEAALGQMARALEPGGRLALLEVDRPASPVLRATHSFYFDRVVPRVGGWLSDRAAYRYLPSSTSYLPETAALLELVGDAGFEAVRRRAVFFGTAQLVTAVRSAT